VAARITRIAISERLAIRIFFISARALILTKMPANKARREYPISPFRVQTLARRRPAPLTPRHPQVLINPKSLPLAPETDMKPLALSLSTGLLALFLLASCGRHPTPPATTRSMPDIAGTWNGHVEFNDQGSLIALDLKFVLNKTAPDYTGTIEIQKIVPASLDPLAHTPFKIKQAHMVSNQIAIMGEHALGPNKIALVFLGDLNKGNLEGSVLLGLSRPGQKNVSLQSTTRLIPE
jgi:hypothetical protein